ncbi:MAG: ABC transporter ATP-binding protein [Candidatus Bipolaricaulis sp.]|nr:ABC transporter ATP-binding protein [Candidatus Bipolaricaulis sp.]MDD5219127.1 ABC transporter ATP-binding protein [Candidatus Bipolaricaulis sp.]MDD5645942.1 ABC transporter ATP-binding protein [Candidatus Bipolaricaulis sp.]
MKKSAAPGSGRDADGYLLRAEGITKVYSDGTVALEEATLEIHTHEIVGLLGENGAGKTTLTKILSGLLPPTRGRVVSPKGPVRFASPREALDFGIGMVHQHFALVGTFTAAENVALSHEKPFSRIRLAETRERLEALMEESGLRVPLDVPVEKLAVGEQQRVEILKVLSRDVKLLILDEPTSVLTPLEVDELFVLLRRLRDRGTSIILITHKLKEVQSVTDRIVVLRRGAMVGDVRTAEATTERLAQLMVGKTIATEPTAVELSAEQVPKTLSAGRKKVPLGEGILHVADLVARGNTGEIAVDGVSFDVHGGEILGIAGVEGNGQSELVECLTGLRVPISGTATIRDTNILGKDPRQIYRLGVAHVPEDRWRLGLVLPFTLAENAILGVHQWEEFRGPFGFVRRGRVNQHVRQLMERFDIQATGPNAPAKSLSGGNQQKLIVGRELAKNPAIVVASQPTRGLDIGAAKYIRDLLIEMRDNGRAILLVSADLDEVLALADRLAIMYEGRFMGESCPGELSREQIGMLMGGVACKEVA